MSGSREPRNSPIPESFAVGDHLDWDSELVPVHLVVELPFFLMMETTKLDIQHLGTSFELLVSDKDVEVFVNEFHDSRANCGYQGSEPLKFETRADVQNFDFTFLRRKQRTTVYFGSACLDDVLASANGLDVKAREAQIYLASLCEAHLPVLNELLRRYRLMTYDYFVYEVSPWDVPVWHVRGGQSGHISVPLFYYASLEGRPWIYPNVFESNSPDDDKLRAYQLALTTGSALAATSSAVAVPGEDDLLDARNLMERGDYNGAVRRATTAIEALVEHVLRLELLKCFDESTADEKLRKSQTDFPGRLRQWQKLSGVALPPAILKSVDRTRSLRHEIVHRGRRLSFEERGFAQQCVDTGRWAFNHIERNAERAQLREFTNMTVRAIARPTLALRFPVDQTNAGFRVRSLRSETKSSGSADVVGRPSTRD